MKTRNFFILFLVLFSALVVELRAVSAYVSSDDNCGLYRSGGAPTGYGAGYNVFHPTWKIFVDCTSKWASVSVMGNGNHKWDDSVITYNTGYVRTSAGWKQFSYAGDPYKQGSPYLRNAQARIDYDDVPDGINYFVAYTCSRDEGRWKCGCRDTACDKSYWQLQGFVKENTEIAGCGTGPTVPILGNPNWPTGHVGKCYKVKVGNCPTGGTTGSGAYVSNATSAYDLASENFPPGLDLYPDGTIRGVPTVPGFYFFSLKGGTNFHQGLPGVECGGTASIQVAP
ncbi:MAG: hypothetical protein A3C84_03260 [Candidatus Ryanbacteria bacterium RIFCSPHIGHO2_02_FULL_48_12]|uniref:Uncharacterized protein n=1 Tax=Candidatus Ryanbacteria bacterium RIFCSPHIGHO2_01_FULL_48_27 TaxID=1802115 RepID=A0A1G2G0F2_9BACT|nr:MAG: hypothetical protein A2756_03280 [Candidatus Ryanbacteria bacterium RIFCSPHIGHO2_01_FULL_48_27]OGZ49336.1 MAG: hypothetical protein A3C84_03260 [Candidatus Ryanbacteria bacterium RIFCSPHIGHO2_02_FULL_48_12]